MNVFFVLKGSKLFIIIPYHFDFGFEGWMWVLIASVPGLCILFTFPPSNAFLTKFYLAVYKVKVNPELSFMKSL